MKKFLFCIFATTISINITFSQKLTREQYIEKYRDLAIQLMKTYGIPASIILSQACLESNNGNSDLTTKGNNHFGIKCAGWQGKTTYHDDDKKNECFRAYQNARESFIDHSDFLRYRKRYAFLFDLKPNDYKGWAKGLKKAGYATSSTYAESLIKIIEDFQLYKYDDPDFVPQKITNPKEIKEYKEYQEKIVPIKRPSKALKEYENDEKFVIFINRKVMKRNNVKYIIAKYNDTYERIGDEFKINALQLRYFNDNDKNSQPHEGDVVYLARKKNKAGKDFPLHIAENDETMRDISQQYAVQLRDLLKYNNINVADTLQEGETIYLRHKMKK